MKRDPWTSAAHSPGLINVEEARQLAVGTEGLAERHSPAANAKSAPQTVTVVALDPQSLSLVERPEAEGSAVADFSALADRFLLSVINDDVGLGARVGRRATLEGVTRHVGALEGGDVLPEVISHGLT